ncbi:MAG: hypothetical protein K0S09_1587 [Sphingobacteriaceae bacterium]|jgi:2'-5' RNA ligase|nr:hypothetical protein [Sphingobacteriaceae bacterium]
MESIYLLAILPPEELSAQINEIRQECSEKFKVYKGLKPPVHITLFRTFTMDNSLEKHLHKLLMPVTHSHHPFEQQVENFDCFNSHVLYIRVLKTEALSAMQREISAIMNKSKIDPRETKTGNTLFTPHITIAYRDIPPETFPLMWEEYQNRKFKRSFTVDRFTLLKHDFKKWNVLEEFRLAEAREELRLF